MLHTESCSESLHNRMSQCDVVADQSGRMRTLKPVSPLRRQVIWWFSWCSSFEYCGPACFGHFTGSSYRFHHPEASKNTCSITHTIAVVWFQPSGILTKPSWTQPDHDGMLCPGQWDVHIIAQDWRKPWYKSWEKSKSISKGRQSYEIHKKSKYELCSLEWNLSTRKSASLCCFEHGHFILLLLCPCSSILAAVSSRILTRNCRLMDILFLKWWGLSDRWTLLESCTSSLVGGCCEAGSSHNSLRLLTLVSRHCRHIDLR